MNALRMGPEAIERRSMEIITSELGQRSFGPGEEAVVKRVIHATADFDFADTLTFSPGVMGIAQDAFRHGVTVITDTNMALAGISQKTLARWHSQAVCFMADADVAAQARERGVTRAVVSMEKAANLSGPLIFVIGNAPTALIRLCGLIKQRTVQPVLVVGVPVGFVNVVESKELLLQSGIPCIVARGRKGGSTVAAAIVNALLYSL